MPIKIVPKQSEEDNERDAREAAVAGPLKAPKKRIVTKEEMKKEGYDNLRDYLNFKQGKVRRKDKNTDIITKGATKLYEERMGPDKAALDRGAAAVKRGGGKNYGVSNLPDDIDRPINMKKGGKVESKLMKKEGRGMAKATMQKVASKVVRGHEKRMHKAKPIDGIALHGKTRGRMR